MEAKYKQHAEAVEKQIEVCNELLGDIGSVLDIFSELKLSQRAISGRTDALKEQCDRLVSEREKLTTVSGSIKERLDHFDRLEELSSLFHAPVSASSDPQAILKGLEDLDTSLAFTSKHPEYLESAKYHAKFRNLQARAMALVKSYFQESVAVSIAECKASMLHDDGSDRGKGQADGGDMTIQNVKFRSIAEPRLKELMAGVCGHSDRPTYEQLIKDCSTVYCKARFELVRYGVLASMQKLTAQGNVRASTTTIPKANAMESPGTTAGPAGTNVPPDESTSPTSGGQVASTTAVGILTGGSEIISRTAEAEIQLYRYIFPGSNHAQAATMLSPLFDSMCILLAAVIEPVIYSTMDRDVQGMCRINSQLVRLVRHETLGAVFNVPSLNKLVQVVERMIVRQAKADWKNSLAESSALLSAEIASPLVALLEPADLDFLRGLGVPLDVAACRAHGNPKPFEPVVRGVQMIAAVKESVGGRSALELIEVIVPGLLDVVHRVCEPSGPSGSSDSSETSEAYGAIFALRQLCLLSQCLESSHVADLDLGRGKSGDGGASADGEITGGKKRGFVSSLSSRIPLLASFSSLTSRTMQGGSGPSGADIVATMEKKTAVARDFCILTCAQDATNPLLSFLTKVTAAKVSGREQIKSHAFATLERVKQLAADVRAAIHGPLLRHIALLHMVMPEPELSAVLEAVRSNLEDALTQMQDIVTAEYTAEAQDIGWVSYEETLTLLFDKRTAESAESAYKGNQVRM